MDEFASKDLGHLGIVAAMCDEIGVVETIDRIIPPDPQAILTTGECVKLMILNGSGFSSKPLYLEEEYFRTKPVSRLLGREIPCEHISDDRLGRTLDRCYESNCDLIFSTLASQAVTRFNVDQRFRHLDSTSMHVHGEYEDGIGLVEFGFSKDERPDLKQFMISLVCSQDGDVPLLAETIAGNTSDQTHFKEVLQRVKGEITGEGPRSYYVADSALYVAETIKNLSDVVLWVSRVPERIKEASDLVKNTSIEEMRSLDDGYHILEKRSCYAGVEQRWLIVHSEKAFKKQEATLLRKIQKEKENMQKEIKRLASKEFSCQEDANSHLKEATKKMKFHSVDDVEITEKRKSGRRGRPKKGEDVDTRFKIKCKLFQNEEKVQEALASKGKFIVATNELDKGELSAEDLLSNYKEQQCVERGFRFLKDPNFMTTSIFLKKEERIMALSMIMCLCLLVYTLTQRQLRLSLKATNETIPSQTGRPVVNPTAKWIYQIFDGVHLLYHKLDTRRRQLVLNLKPLMLKILHLLGPPFERYYENVA
jgi:transposase